MRVEGEIVIERPPEEVFDFVGDECNEPQYNPRMTRADKISSGPIGVGTRFRSVMTGVGGATEMTIEFTGYDRPSRITEKVQLSNMDINGALFFEPVPEGTRMKWIWDLEPHGINKLMGPLVRRIGEQQERTIWTSLKHVLESQPRPPQEGAIHPRTRSNQRGIQSAAGVAMKVRGIAKRVAVATEGIGRSVDYTRPTTYRRPPALYRHMQGLAVFLAALGLVPETVVVLEVRGRRSGKRRRTVVVRTSYQGEHYLVALAGESEWVRNVRAAHGQAVIRHGHAQRVELVEMPVDQRPPIIRAYLHRAGWSSPAQEARHYFGLRRDTSLEEIQPIVGRYPVFRIADASVRQRDHEAPMHQRGGP